MKPGFAIPPIVPTEIVDSERIDDSVGLIYEEINGGLCDKHLAPSTRLPLSAFRQQYSLFVLTNATMASGSTGVHWPLGVLPTSGSYLLVGVSWILNLNLDPLDRNFQLEIGTGTGVGTARATITIPKKFFTYPQFNAAASGSRQAMPMANGYSIFQYQTAFAGPTPVYFAILGNSSSLAGAVSAYFKSAHQ